MNVLLGSHEGEWLERRLHGWGVVSGVVGTGWDSYARILHPLEGRLLDWTDHGEGMVPRVVDERAWTWAEVAAAVGATMHSAVQSRRLLGEPGQEASVNGWDIQSPHEGWIDPATLARLVPALAAATATPDDAVLAVWEGWGEFRASAWFGWDESGAAVSGTREPELSDAVRVALDDPHRLRLPGRDYIRIGCALSELEDPDWGYAVGLGWRHPHRDPSPQLIWPRDRAWVLGTEIDFDSTLVGGSRALIDAILADPSVEALEVHADSDLTWTGDRINPPR